VAEQKKEKNHQRDRHSQRYNCPFMIRASFNLQTGLWHILAINLEYNHKMMIPEHKKFLNNQRIIPQEIKDRIKIYHQQFKREINGFEYEIKVDESSNELLQ
ncbi:7401_t:CDS:2, partial [Funneliformis caledonium]